MNDKNQEAKLCPLLSIDPENTDATCLGPLCAWYILNGYPGKGGYCAVAKLASIGGYSHE